VSTTQTMRCYIMSDPRMARLLGVSLVPKLVREVSEASGVRGMIGGQTVSSKWLKAG
jgi:hypothetical protein